jgi:hypothetical protein
VFAQKPAFIAFTGVDDSVRRDDLAGLSARYPIEWGILVDDSRENDLLFPSASTRARLLSGAPLRWAAHVCGAQARAIASDACAPPIDLSGFSRVQVNHSFAGSDAQQVVNVAAFGRRNAVRAVLQCSTTFPDDAGVDWLFDVSFGNGARPSAWPRASSTAFCGYSGGLNAANVQASLGAIGAPADLVYWIDMESGVRTDGRFDVAKCAAVCRAVYD